MDDQIADNPSDLFLSPDLTEAQARAYLQSLGFRDAAAVDEHLQRMADDLVIREALGRLAPDLIPALLESPDPDAAVADIVALCRRAHRHAMLLDYLREDPRALHVLTYVMGASPLLSEILVRTPEYFHWLVSQVERSAPDRQDHEEELVSALSAVDDPVEGLEHAAAVEAARDAAHRHPRSAATRDRADRRRATLRRRVVSPSILRWRLSCRQRLDAAGLGDMPGRFAVVAARHAGRARDGILARRRSPVSVRCAGRGHRRIRLARSFFVDVVVDLTAALGTSPARASLYRVVAPWPRFLWRAKRTRVHWPNTQTHFGRVARLPRRLSLTRARPIAGDADLGEALHGCLSFVCVPHKCQRPRRVQPG